MKALIGTLFLLLCVSSGAHAADSDLIDRKAAALYESVMSPYCPGRTLSACPSDAARELREKIRADLEVGKSDEEIQRELSARYGDLAGKPSTAASSLLSSSVVAMFFIVGAALIIVLIRSKKKASENA